MKNITRLITACALSFLVSHAWAQSTPATSPVGSWKTIDDVTGKTKSVVVIKDDGGVLSGRIDKLLDPAVSPTEKCVDCPGDRAGAPIVGLTILTGMKQAEGNEWSGGQILDPSKGKLYKCKMKVIDGGEKLEVRGYIGVSLFGRTQTWVRYK